MPFTFNSVHLVGRLGRDPDVRYTSDGKAVARFSVATDRPAKPGAEHAADWHQIVCWEKLAEVAAQYLAKGRLVFVAGRLGYRSWEDKDGRAPRATEIVAGDLILLDRPSETPHQQPGRETYDEIPF